MAPLAIFTDRKAGSILTDNSIPRTECGSVDSAQLNPLKSSLVGGLRRGMVEVSFPLKYFLGTFPVALPCGVIHCFYARLPD